MFAYGDLEQVTETEAKYRIGTAPGSSGSPVLNWKAEALAMHKRGEIGDTQNAAPLTERPELNRTATLLSTVVDAYLQERPLLKTIECGSVTYVPVSQQRIDLLLFENKECFSS